MYKQCISKIVLVFLAGVVSIAVCNYTYAQTTPTNTVLITELQYNASDSGDWIEVKNNSASAIDIATLTIKISTFNHAPITADSGNNNATLAPGATAIIAESAISFKKVHTNYTGLLFTTTDGFPTPAKGAQETISLYESNRTTLITTFTYIRDERTHESGISLHVGVDDTIVAAPETPGSIAIHPMQAFAPVETLMVTATTTGGSDAGDYHFVTTDNVVTLTVLHTEKLPDSLTVKVLTTKGDKTTQERTATLEASKTTRVSQVYTYTIQNTDHTGAITYKVERSGTVLAQGTLTTLGKKVVIDRSAPTATITLDTATAEVRKDASVKIVDDYPAEEVGYKLGLSKQCTTEKDYTDATGKELTLKTTPVQNENNARAGTIPLAGADLNNTYICIKVSDIVGNITYVSSAKIAKLTETTLAISEISYAPTSGASYEWVEITNYGSNSESIEKLLIADFVGGKEPDTFSTPTHYQGSTIVAQDQVFIIAKDPVNFLSEFPTYKGALYSASLSLQDDGDTIILKKAVNDETSVEVDRVTYKKADGAAKNNKTLHVKQTGSIFEDFPTPGVKTTEPREEKIPEIPVQPATALGPGVPKVIAKLFDREENTIPGRNLFFTKKDEVDIVISFTDDKFHYTRDNEADKITLQNTATSSNFEVSARVKRELFGGEYQMVYKIKFAQGQNPVTDNRVTLTFTVEDNENNIRRTSFTVVRTTQVPTLTGATNAAVLGFAAKNPGREEDVIVPVTVGNIQFGDWVRIEYLGTCGNGSLKFMARNGAYGIPFALRQGRYQGCIAIITDTAGNRHRGLILPTLIVTHDA